MSAPPSQSCNICTACRKAVEARPGARLCVACLDERWPKPTVAVDGWMTEIRTTTRCKHGKGPCEKCGTTDRRDVIHSARTPNKREARRQRKKAR